jgi:hypothetical protein
MVVDPATYEAAGQALYLLEPNDEARESSAAREDLVPQDVIQRFVGESSLHADLPRLPRRPYLL